MPTDTAKTLLHAQNSCNLQKPHTKCNWTVNTMKFCHLWWHRSQISQVCVDVPEDESRLTTMWLTRESKCHVHVPVDRIKAIYKLSLQPCFCYQQVQANLATTTIQQPYAHCITTTTPIYHIKWPQQITTHILFLFITLSFMRLHQVWPGSSKEKLWEPLQQQTFSYDPDVRYWEYDNVVETAFELLLLWTKGAKFKFMLPCSR